MYELRCNVCCVHVARPNPYTLSRRSRAAGYDTVPRNSASWRRYRRSRETRASRRGEVEEEGAAMAARVAETQVTVVVEA